jgi:hypothetical protein
LILSKNTQSSVFSNTWSTKMSGRGLSQASMTIINEARAILAQIHPATVRGVSYQLFTRGVINSMSLKNTQNVSRLMVTARERGMIPWGT